MSESTLNISALVTGIVDSVIKSVSEGVASEHGDSLAEAALSYDAIAEACTNKALLSRSLSETKRLRKEQGEGDA